MSGEGYAGIAFGDDALSSSDDGFFAEVGQLLLLIVAIGLAAFLAVVGVGALVGTGIRKAVDAGKPPEPLPPPWPTQVR